MKINFIIPLMDDYDVNKAYKHIEKACTDSGVNFDVMFALNAKLNVLFTKIRNVFAENKKVKGFMVERSVNVHKLITVAMEKSEKYDAVIIYSGKEEPNVDVIKAFISSWQAGNKIVYLKKIYRGFKKVSVGLGRLIYSMGVKILNVFKDVNAETDIQMLDNDVVKTINQLPAKNRQLRVQDALLYYATDIIHLEVDAKMKANEMYAETDKSALVNGLISFGFLALGLVCGLISILGMSLSWEFKVFVHLILWGGVVLFGFFFLLFFARKTLLKRVGRIIDPSEYVAIKDNINYYNMQ